MPSGKYKRTKPGYWTGKTRVFTEQHKLNISRGSIGKRIEPREKTIATLNGKCAVTSNNERGLILGYGITEPAFNALLKRQNGLCAMCGKPETRKSQNGNPCRLSIDHDHKTGIVRGLLCNKCNHTLGHYERNRKRCETYLESHATVNIIRINK